MQANAVEQLGFICRHQLRQASNTLHIGVGIVSCTGLRHGLVDRHALQDHAHFFQQGTGGKAQVTQRLAGVHHQGTIAMGQSFDQGEHMAAVHAAQHIAHHGFGQCAVAKSDGLVG